MNDSPRPRAERGFTLVEILVVIVILGIISTVTVFAVRGLSDRGEKTACAADRQTIETAAGAWMAQESLEEVPALGSSADRYELFLVDAGMIKQVSTHWNLNPDGTATPATPC